MLLKIFSYTFLNLWETFMCNYTVNLVNFEGPRNVSLENLNSLIQSSALVIKLIMI